MTPDLLLAERFELASWAVRGAVPVFALLAHRYHDTAALTEGTPQLTPENLHDSHASLTTLARVPEPITEGTTPVQRRLVERLLTEHTWFSYRQAMRGTGIPGLLFERAFDLCRGYCLAELARLNEGDGVEVALDATDRLRASVATAVALGHYRGGMPPIGGKRCP